MQHQHLALQGLVRLRCWGVGVLCCVLGWSSSALAASPVPSPSPAPSPSCPALLQRTFLRLQDEKPQSLCQYRGQVLLVVNTASYCGFTSQYEGLEQLYRQYQSRGLVVLGFPSNDFGEQEPGNNAQIAAFCSNTFDVKFPMFAKSSVSGAAANPLFQDLARITGSKPMWNFHKYLIGRDGRAVDYFNSLTGPDNSRLIKAVQAELDKKAP